MKKHVDNEHGATMNHRKNLLMKVLMGVGRKGKKGK
jgi:hypothetical protein